MRELFSGKCSTVMTTLSST